MPSFESNGSFGIVLPAGTPAGVIANLDAAFLAVLNDPATVKRIRDLGAEPLPMIPAEFGNALCQAFEGMGPVFLDAARKANVDLEPTVGQWRKP